MASRRYFIPIFRPGYIETYSIQELDALVQHFNNQGVEMLLCVPRAASQLEDRYPSQKFIKLNELHITEIWQANYAKLVASLPGDSLANNCLDSDIEMFSKKFPQVTPHDLRQIIIAEAVDYLCWMQPQSFEGGSVTIDGILIDDRPLTKLAMYLLSNANNFGLKSGSLRREDVPELGVDDAIEQTQNRIKEAAMEMLRSHTADPAVVANLLVVGKQEVSKHQRRLSNSPPSPPGGSRIPTPQSSPSRTDSAVVPVEGFNVVTEKSVQPSAGGLFGTDSVGGSTHVKRLLDFDSLAVPSAKPANSPSQRN